MKRLMIGMILPLMLVGCGTNHSAGIQSTENQPNQDLSDSRAEDKDVDEALENILNQLDELDQILDKNQEGSSYE